jgi:hypothetical protein
MGSDEIIRPFEEPVENVVPRWSLLRRLQARRHARRFEPTRQTDEQRLAQRVQQIIVGYGLTQAGYSISGGRSLHIPQVVTVNAGPPVKLDIRTLPGQTLDDFAAHAPAIAFNLDVREVRVIPLQPSLIRLELLP